MTSSQTQQAYCVPRGNLTAGAKVPSSLDFFAELKHLADGRNAVEDLLEQFRPSNVPQRRTAIFLFLNINDARQYALTKRRGLFLVEIPSNSSMAKCDWCWLAIIEKALNVDSKEVDDYAKAYWNGDATKTPIWELLVFDATVVREIPFGAKERRDLVNRSHEAN